MAKKKTPFSVRLIFYKYDISEKQDGSDAEYEILFSDFINHGFWIPDLDWLKEMVIDVGDFDSLDCFNELPFGQVHEILANIEPWAEQDPYAGDWDGGVYWHDFAHQRLTGEELKEFLIFHPRCNRLHGLNDENIWREEGGQASQEGLEFEMAIESADVPEIVRKMESEDRDKIKRFFKMIFTKYALGIHEE